MDYEHEECLDDEYLDDYGNEEDEDFEDEFGEPEYQQSTDDPGIKIRPTRWINIKVNGIVLCVGSHGVIRKYGEEIFCGTRGYPMIGTPFRTYSVSGFTYFVHDIVWRAFHGDPPSGWEVRHEITQKKKWYDNSLHCLTIAPKIVEYGPVLFDTSS